MVLEPWAVMFVQRVRSGEDPFLMFARKPSCPACPGRGCRYALWTSFHTAATNQPGFRWTDEPMCTVVDSALMPPPAAPSHGRPLLTPRWTGPQARPDSLDMLECDCVHEALHVGGDSKAGGACMHDGHRTPA